MTTCGYGHAEQEGIALPSYGQKVDYNRQVINGGPADNYSGRADIEGLPGHDNRQNVNNGYNTAHVTNEMYSNHSVEAPSSLKVSDSFKDHDCFRIVRSSKRMEIPCTRNEYRRYKVRVPRVVTKRVPRRVQYTDYETKSRVEPYTSKRFETAYRDENQPYTIQVPKKVTKMVKVTKKVPKTVYVDVVSEVPQEQTVMVPETRTRLIKVPYQKEVVDEQYRTVQETIPITKWRTEYDTVSETVYDESWQTEVVPVTKIVQKEIPVYNLVPKAPGECGNCDQLEQYPSLPLDDGQWPIGQYQRTEYIAPAVYDTNNDGVLSMDESARAHKYGQLLVEADPVTTYTAPPHYDYNHNGVLNPNELQDAGNNGDLQVLHGPVQLERTPELHNAPPVNTGKPPEPNEAAVPNPSQQEVSIRNASDVKPMAEEQPKVEKWIKTQYSAPAEYDLNNNGVLDPNEREAANADGNLQVDSIAVVRGPNEDEVIEEQLFSQPLTQRRRRRKKKSSRRGRRKSRR